MLKNKKKYGHSKRVLPLEYVFRKRSSENFQVLFLLDNIYPKNIEGIIRLVICFASMVPLSRSASYFIHSPGLTEYEQQIPQPNRTSGPSCSILTMSLVNIWLKL